MNFKKNFQIMMREIKKYNPSVEFIAIGITYSDVLDKKSYGYNDNVSIYNKILAQIFHNNFIDINTIIGTNGLISDHIHLNKVSHQKLFEFLKNKIEDYKI
jgi:lysophospholipase L1-like esterase